MSQDEKEGSEIMKLETAKVCDKSVIARPGRQSQYPQGTVQFSCSVVSNSATPWTAAHQAPPSMGFSRQEYWSGLVDYIQSMGP